MTYIKDICNIFGFSYLDFLEENLFKNPTQEAEQNNRGGLAIMEAMAQNETKKERSDTELFNSELNKTFLFPEIDFKESFYLGHFEIKSLLDTQEGRGLIFNILDYRAKKIYDIRKDFKEILKYRNFNNNEEIINKVGDILTEKGFLTYKQYLEQYENKANKENQKFIHFYKTYKADKENFIYYTMATNQPTQTFIKKKLEAYIPNKERYKHTYIIAGTGSGKSELIKGLIYSVLKTQKKKDPSKRENFILIEPHSDLSTQIFNLCSNFKTDTVLLDPFLNYEKTPVLNPFDFEGTESELSQYTEELIAVFKEILGEDFTRNGQAILTPCIATLLRIPNTSLYDLQTFMNDEENEQLVNRGKITTNTAHKIFFETGFYKATFKTTKNALDTRIQLLLNNPTFSNLTTGKSTINIEQIMNSGQNLVVKLNKQKMRETLEPFGRFIISKIQSVALKRVNVSANKRQKTHLFIDEFQNFVTPTISEILTESRKYKLFLTMAHQVLKQIEESKLKDIILSNTNIKIVGNNGLETISKLSKEIRVKAENFDTLKVGQFYARIGHKSAFKFSYRMLDPYFLKFSEETKKQLKEQEKKYYVKPTSRKVIIKSDHKKDFINEIIKDKKDQLEQAADNKEDKPIKRGIKPKFDKF